MKAAHLIFCGFPTSGPLSSASSAPVFSVSPFQTTPLQLIYSNLEPVSEGICNERGVETPPCSVVSQGPAPWRLAEAAAPWALLKTGVGPTRPGVGWVVCVTGWRLQGSGDTFGQRGVSHGDFCSGCTGYKEKLDVYQVFSYRLRLGQGWSCGKPRGGGGSQQTPPLGCPACPMSVAPGLHLPKFLKGQGHPGQ